VSRVFVYSDPHFGHKNIIVYENRPFRDIQDMDESLIQRWNNKVKKEDRVFVLGDVSFYSKEKTAEIISRLNGRKSLILGNHDRGRSVKWWSEVGFDAVYEFPICYRGFFWMSHEPMHLNADMPYVNIHGHIHGQLYQSEQYVNVSVEVIGYEPILFDDIIARFSKEGEQGE